MERQATIAQEQAKLMDSQLKATEAAAQAAGLQADVAERSFNRLERPILLVKDIEGIQTAKHVGAVGYGGRPLPTDPTARFAAHIMIENFGRSAAIVDELLIVALSTERLPDILEHRVSNCILHETVVRPGTELGRYPRLFNPGGKVRLSLICHTCAGKWTV